MFDQVSPGADSTGPEFGEGQSPVRWRWLSAHDKISSTVSGGRSLRFRTSRCSDKSLASEEPPGSPRWPIFKAVLILIHTSPRDPSMAPESRFGHCEVCW